MIPSGKTIGVLGTRSNKKSLKRVVNIKVSMKQFSYQKYYFLYLSFTAMYLPFDNVYLSFSDVHLSFSDVYLPFNCVDLPFNCVICVDFSVMSVCRSLYSVLCLSILHSIIARCHSIIQYRSNID